VVIIQVVIFKEDILSYGVTEISAVSQRRIFGNCWYKTSYRHQPTASKPDSEL